MRELGTHSTDSSVGYFKDAFSPSAIEILEAGAKYERERRIKKEFDPKGEMLLAVIF